MRQRLRQLREATVLPAPADYELARAHLPPPLFDLFAAQHPRDILHSAATARWLLARGQDDPDLLAAAFLHDIGKGHQRPGDRVAYVVASGLRLAPLAASARSRFELRRALARTHTHSRTGAAALVAAGAPERVVDLTRRHHESPGHDPVLALLQAADAAS